MAEPLVIIGNGMGAAKLVEELTRLALGRYSILLVGAEPSLAYNRVLLSSLLAGEVGADDMQLKPRDWWTRHGVTLVYGRRVTGVNPNAHTIVLDDGAVLPFAKLVLATGSSPIRLSKPGMDLPGVLTFRERDDVAAMLAATGPAARAVVVGGGLLGVEAAYGLSKTGASVTLVHLMDRLMERQLDAEAAAMLRSAMEARGVRVLLNADTAAVEGEGCVEAVRLADGRILPADIVVSAVGIRPNVDLARDAGLSLGRGVRVDDRLRSSHPDIFAIGECAEHRGVTYGLVEPTYDQARALAAHLAGRPDVYGGSVLATNLKVSGVPVFSAGDFTGEDAETVVLRDPGLKSYRKLVIRDDRLVGAVLFGETGDGLWYLDLIRAGAPLGRLRADVIFGRALAQAA